MRIFWALGSALGLLFYFIIQHAEVFSFLTALVILRIALSFVFAKILDGILTAANGVTQLRYWVTAFLYGLLSMQMATPEPLKLLPF